MTADKMRAAFIARRGEFPKRMTQAKAYRWLDYQDGWEDAIAAQAQEAPSEPLASDLYGVGVWLANVAFNWSQQCGHTLTSDDCALLDKLRKQWDAAHSAPASVQAAVPDGWKLGQPITEEMHVAAVKVLQRANGLDGLPQRMIDAMISAAPSTQQGGGE